MAHPAPWALACAAGATLAMALPPWAPDWLFWGAVGASCASASAWTLARGRAARRDR